MSNNLPATSQPVNPQPGYYAVIPVKVLRCKSLPSSAKLLYGDISALCSVEGYSWASNDYFAALYDVDERTVKRWLAALVKAGFIKVLVNGPNRRIYLAETAPKPAKSRTKMSRLGGQKCPGKHDKNVTHSITSKNTLNNTSEDAHERPRFVGPGPVPARLLKEAEEKGSASPPTVEAPPAVRQVERAVAACGDHSARGPITKLWEIVERSGCADVWRCGLDAVKSPKDASTGRLEPPAALFCRVVALALGERGVALSGQFPAGGPFAASGA